MEIVDTAGSHNFPAMRELSIKSGRGFVLVYSVDNLQSFHEAVHVWELIKKYRGSKVPIILVGNKSDLVEERQVSHETAKQTVTEMMNNCKYIETSAKYNINVSQLFVELLQQAKNLEQPVIAEPSERKVSRRLSRRLSSLGNLSSLGIRRKFSVSRLNSQDERDEGKCYIL